MVRFLILLFAFSFSLFAKEPLRTWTSADGRTLEARFLEIIGDEVRLEEPNGKRFNLKINIFSDLDKQYFAEAYRKSLFAGPIPFDGNTKGAVIITSLKGDVKILEKKRSTYSKFSPQFRKVIVGESIGHGTTLVTGKGSEITFVLTNGSLAYIGPNSEMNISEMWQKSGLVQMKKFLAQVKKQVHLGLTLN